MSKPLNLQEGSRGEIKAWMAKRKSLGHECSRSMLHIFLDHVEGLTANPLIMMI
jgi:hypothetical protein